MTLNKLGLTEEERTVFYKDADGKSLVAELRQYDPHGGLLKMLDPFKNEVIEFYWDAGSSTWKGTGLQSGYTTEVSIETPLVKEVASDAPDKAVTVSRFPAWEKEDFLALKDRYKEVAAYNILIGKIPWQICKAVRK